MSWPGGGAGVGAGELAVRLGPGHEVALVLVWVGASRSGAVGYPTWRKPTCSADRSSASAAAGAEDRSPSAAGPLPGLLHPLCLLATDRPRDLCPLVLKRLDGFVDLLLHPSREIEVEPLGQRLKAVGEGPFVHLERVQ